MLNLLTWNDVFNAAFWAFVAVLVIRIVGGAFRRVVTRTMRYEFDPSRLEDILLRFHRVFPIETLCFGGTTIQRGTIIRIITNQQLSIEGEFLGTNRSNMLGIVTRDSIITQELTGIEAIQTLGKTSRPEGVQ